MHGAAPAATHAGLLAEELRHQWREPGSFADRMTVRAVIAGDVVALTQRHARTDDLAFLSGRVVHHSWNGLHVSGRRRIEQANAEHPTQHFVELRPLQLHEQTDA